MTVKAIRNRIRSLLYDFRSDPRIQELEKQIRTERQPEIDRLELALAAAEKQVKPKKRWPDDVPKEVMEHAEKYWRGTTSYSNFRIHHWNDKAIWTSYPSGGYSVVAGWTSTPPAYHLVSRVEFFGVRPKCLKILSFDIGSKKRVTSAMMVAELNQL
jgi:hypothetical protein